MSARSFGFVGVLTVFAGMAAAQDITTVNGLKVDARFFNDYGDSTLSITTSGTSARVDEGPFNAPTGGTFANKHRLFLSNDGGTTRFGLNQQQAWQLRVDYRADTSYTGTQPGIGRKEGALEFYVPLVNELGQQYFDEGRFLVGHKTSAAGQKDEIALFGGTMPFTGFGLVYEAGDIVTLFMNYTPGDGVPLSGPQATLQVGYSINGGPTVWGSVNEWGDSRSDGFTTGTQIAFVAQNSPVTPGDVAGFSQTTFHEWNNFSVVPAPGAAALLGMGLVAAGRRRR